MKLYEIENLPFAELKARRDELVDAAKKAPVDELAARYLQARTDAKRRDELLAEQAETLAALKKGLEAVEEREAAAVVAANDSVAKMTEEIDDLRSQKVEHEVVNTAARCSLEIAEHENTELKARCERLNTQAKSATEAMTTVQAEALSAVGTIQKVVTDVLRNDATDKANEGE